MTDTCTPTTDRRSPLLSRLFRLWRLYGSMDLLWATKDLKQFLIYFLSELILNAASVTAVLLLAVRFDGIGGWTKDQVLFMLSYAMLVNGILAVLFGYNILFISRRIGRGQLDHLLIQPQPIWLSLLTEGFTPFDGGTGLVMGVGMMIWTVRRLGLDVTPGWIALLAVNVAASAAIIVSFTYLWSSLAFWAPRAAEEISSSAMRIMTQLKSFPLGGLGPGLLGLSLTVLPIGFAAWHPSLALLGLDPLPYGGAVTPAAALAFSSLAAWVFQKGLKQYARTGSQRYLSFGHRR